MKSLPKAFTGIVLPVLLLISFCSYSQRSDRPITPDEQKQIIDKAFSLLKQHYIFPERIAPMEKEIYKKINDRMFAKYTAADEFLKHLDADLETLSNDRHIDIFYDPIRVKQIETEGKDDNKNTYAPEFLQRAKYENYLVKKAERLDGNVGYLKFNSFVDTALSRKTLSAAMEFLSNSSALIIDLRQNGGGDSRTCSYLLSYFLPESTLLMKRRSRTEKSTYEYIPKSGIKKFSKDVPVYILTSKRTSSAAEAFAYTLQSYKRATVIGDTTNGEANPGYLFAVNSEMYIMIPAFENINPVTKTNWQAIGVIPDIKIVADKALAVAQQKAYQQLAEISTVGELKSMYNWMADGLLAEVQPFSVSENDLKIFAGDYADERHLVFENGSLFYYRGNNVAAKKKMTAIKKDLFAVDGVPFFRVYLVKDEKGEAVALEGVYDDGKKEVSKKL